MIIPAGSKIPRLKGRRLKKISRGAEEVASKTFPSALDASNYERFLNDFIADAEARKRYLDSLPRNKRYELERDAPGSFTFDEWYALCQKYEFRCLRCGEQNVKLTVDHVVPLSKGGSHWISNLQPLCGPCNSSKGVKDTDYR